MKRYGDWLSQAKDDFVWGSDSLATKHYAQCCFIAQQVAEKACKAIAYFRGFDMIKGHSVASIARELKINDTMEKAAKRLDQYYISTRYPDAMPQGAPFEYFTEEQAREALSMAQMFVEYAEKEINGKE